MSELVNILPMAGLSNSLHQQFVDWLDRRKPQEEKMLRMYNDNMRIYRDDDTKDSGMSKAQKSRVFVGSTRSKIRSARAKIKDSLFANGTFPFDTKPANEKLKGFADTMEAVLSFQFEECHARKVLGQGVDAITTFGTGFIFGPFVKSLTHTSVAPDNSAGYSKIKESKSSYDCPYYEHGRSLDCYPDPEAEDVQEGSGIYWSSRKTPDYIRSLKGQPGYADSAIDLALSQKVTGTTSEGSDRAEDSRQALYRWTKEGRIWFNRYFGKCKKVEFLQWKHTYLDGPEPGDVDQHEMIEVVILMAGGNVIKADESPYKDGKRPVAKCVYEDVEHEMWGVGIAENNDPNQRVVNAAFRLFLEAKALSLLPLFSFDRSKFETSEDFKFFPGKRFAFRGGLSPDEKKDALIFHQFPDVSAGWESAIEMSQQFSDDDTAVTKYTQGNDSQHLNKTATGISMIMGASSLPLKEVLTNIDAMWIEEMVEGLIDWNLEHLEVETVQMLLGDEHAKNWAAIKDYGKANFMEWFATGSQTFMAKEILMQKLQGFLQLVASNPNLENRVDLTELLNQVWDAGQIGKESPIFDEETFSKQQSNPAMQQAQKAIEEVKQQASQAIKEAQDQAQQQVQAAEQKAQEAQRQEAFNLAKLDVDKSKAEFEHQRSQYDLLLRFKESGEQSHLLEAQIDKLQAEVLAALAQAQVRPDAELEKQGTSAESESSQSSSINQQLIEAIKGMGAKRQVKVMRQPDGSLLGESASIPETIQ